MSKQPQPASKSYFFSKGYTDVWNTIKSAWGYNWESVKKHWDNIKMNPSETKMGMVGYFLMNFSAILAVGLFGSIVTGFMTAVNLIVLVVFMAFIYICFSILWLIDRLYLMKNKISSACTECKEQSLIPLYLCPNCHVVHDNLVPSSYGIWQRTCSCGEKLPTNCFNGRKDLESKCPACSLNLDAKETRPLCVPVVGGRSVGKTAFITAFSKDFIENVAPANGITTEFYNQSKEEIFNEITQDYSTGSTRMTQRSGDVNQTSSVSFSFFAKHQQFSPGRLVHVYDIAGEIFTSNDENEVQKQYEYCQGIVFILDPFAIPSVRNKYFEDLSDVDKTGIGKADINGIIDSFLNKLREVTNLSDKKSAAVPLAVVISKVDSAGLREELGEVAVHKLMQSNPERFSNFHEAQDYLCQEFLKENEMESFLNSIRIQFKTNYFFACSAIGHSRDSGQYNPSGVMAPMQWLFSMADPKMAQVWNDITFVKRKNS